ncbi:MAG: aminomethyltransferase family protein [Acidimicrobiia bacterium]|nr:aminomethyltransferase family protein [Acidimicrobiia bacterium]
MVRYTAFHDRTRALNTTELWSHWAGYLAADRYQLSEKFEYFAIRNSVGMFDTSPLYKYRIQGGDAETFLAGLLTRNIRKCRPGNAQYTIWCDDNGFIIEDGVIIRQSETEFLLSTAEPNLAYFEDRIGRLQVTIDDISDDMAALAVQGPRSKTILTELIPEVAGLGYFQATEAKIGEAPVVISRTGFTGDLGYEIWVENDYGLAVWDAVARAGEGYGILPFGTTALLMARIEAGLALIDVDFSSSRYAWTDADRTTPMELGLGWMVRDIDDGDRQFIGRRAILREMVAGSRWNLIGLLIDWRDWFDVYDRNGLVPPKDHLPHESESILYDATDQPVGYATSLMYSPMVQRHIAIARVQPELAVPGNQVNMEVTINHTWQQVKAQTTRMPFYNPPHKTA